MNTPVSVKDKLFALAAAAAKAAKEGHMGKALNTINIMAHVCDDQSLDEARTIMNTLKEQEPKLKGVKDYFASVKIDIDPDEEENPDDSFRIDTSRFTHEEILFMLVVLLGGNLRAMGQNEDDKEERNKNARNASKLIGMIVQWVTKEDWDKAHAMIENRPPPEDGFQRFLSA